MNINITKTYLEYFMITILFTSIAVFFACLSFMNLFLYETPLKFLKGHTLYLY